MLNWMLKCFKFVVMKKVILLSPFVVFLLFVFLSSFTPVLTRGEGREGLVIKAMEWGESIILPLRHGTEVPSKPPFFHWIGYGVSKLTNNIGPMEIRAGSALGSTLLLVGTYLFFSQVETAFVATLISLVLFSSLEFIRYSTQARVDPIFAGVFSWAVFSIFRFYEGTSSRVLSGAAVVIFLVLSVLAKGPFGLVLPVAVLMFYLAIRRERLNYSVLFKGVGLFLVALILGSVWYFLAYKVAGERFLEVQLLKENAYRVVKAEGDERGHEKPFFFTFIYLFLATIPWSLFLPRIFFGLRAMIKEGELRQNKYFALSMAWISLFLLAVLFSVSKRSVYFLPALPAVSYLIVLGVIKSQSLTLRSWVLRYEKILSGIVALLFSVMALSVFLALISSFWPSLISGFSFGKRDDLVRNILSSLSVPCLGLEFVVLILAVKYLGKGFKQFVSARVEDGMSLISVVFILVFFMSQILVVSSVTKELSPAGFSGEVNRVLSGAKSKVFQYKNEFYAAAFYLDRYAPVVDSEEEVLSCEGEECLEDRYMLASQSKLSELKRFHLELESTQNLANGDDKLCLLKLDR